MNPSRPGVFVLSEPPQTGPPGVSYSHANPHTASCNSSKLPLKHSYQFMGPVAFVPGKLIWKKILYICLYFQIWVCHFTLWPQPSNASEQKSFFSSLFSFFLVARMNWWLSSSLHVRGETRSALLLFFILQFPLFGILLDYLSIF